MMERLTVLGLSLALCIAISIAIGVATFADVNSKESYPAIVEKIPAGSDHGWQFRLDDSYTISVPYASWKRHSVGDKAYVQAYRSWASNKDVFLENE